MSIEAMKQALEALEQVKPLYDKHHAIVALRQAIEQAKKQEPVAWITHESKWRLTGGGNANGTAPVHAKKSNTAKYPLYITPQPQPCPYIRSTREGTHHCALSQREWVGLTQRDIDIAFDDTQEGGGFNEFARAIEQTLKRKNT